jgi:WD40 repeat protein
VHPGSESETLLELLVQWEELRRQGKTLTPEELCPDDAQLQALLRERLARRQRLHAALDFPTSTQREPVAKPASLPVIDGYEIGELLGRGGMGLVFKAVQKALKRPVALKIIVSGAHASAEERARFRAEAEAVARLHHPGIVQIYEVGEQAGCPYLALEFVNGGSLAQQLDGTPMPSNRAAQLLLDLSRAVQHAHERGIIHRDLKPGNTLLTADGMPKVADFGLAKSLQEAGGARTRTGAILGTPCYMAPEQAEGRSSGIGPAADIYALGAILYELLTGRPPFRGDSTLESLVQVRSEEPVSPRRLQPRLPGDLETICLKCLQKEPRERYPSALALAEDLQRFVKGEPILARPVSQGEKLWRWCRRKPLVAALLASVMLLVLFVAVGTPLAAFSWRQQRDEARRNEGRAASAEQDAREKLWQSYLAQADLWRSTKQIGQRFQGLEVIRKASLIRRAPAVREAAIACLALPDLKLSRQWLPPTGMQPIAFDALLQHYAYKDRQFHIRVRSVAEDRELVALPGPPTPTYTPYIKFSPDGRYLAALYGFPDAQLSKVFTWDLSQRAKLFEKLTDDDVAPRFSPDSRSLALASSNGSIGIFAIPGGEELLRLEKSCRPHSLAFDPSGRRLAVSSDADKLVEIRDLDKAGRVVAKFTHPGGVSISAWRGDGLLLATGCADRNVYVWDVSANRQLGALTGHRDAVTFLAFNRAGDLLVSTSWDDATKLWDPVTGANLLTVQGYCWGIAPDEERLAISDGAVFGLWQLAGRRECRTLHFGRVGQPAPEGDLGGPWSVDFSSDGRLLAASGEDGVRLWDVPAGTEVAHLPAGLCESAFFLPGDISLITYGHEGLQRWPIPYDHASLRDASPGPPVLLRAVTKSKNYRAVLSQDGNRIAYLDFANHQTAVIDPNVPEKQMLLKGTPREQEVALSPTARWVAVGDWRSTEGARIWDLTTGAKVWQLPLTDSLESSCRVAFSPNGQWLVTSEVDRYRFWQVVSWAPGPVIRRERLEPPGPLAFTHDSRMLAITRSRWMVQLIETATGQEIATLSAPDPQHINSLCFSPDGDLLAVATKNHAVQLWDLRLIRQRLQEMGLDWDVQMSR